MSGPSRGRAPDPRSGVRLFREALTTVVRADRRGAAAALGWQLLGALAGLGLILASQMALTVVLERPGEDGLLITALVVLAVATALSGAAGVLQTLQQRLLAERVSQVIWQDLLRSSAGVDLIAYESSDFVETLERVRASAVSRPLAVVNATLGLIGSALTVVVVAIPIMSIQPLILPLLLVTGLPVVLISRKVSAAEFAFTRRSGAVVQRRAYLRALLSSRVSAAEIRAFQAGPELIRRTTDADAAYLGSLSSHVRHRRRLALLTLGASAAGLLMTLGVVALLLSRGDLTVPEAGAAVVATRLLGGQLTTAFRAFGSLVESGPFLRDVHEFFERHPPRVEAGERHDLREALEAVEVDFTYPGQQQPALSGVSLTVRRGTVVALVGENGSGKTTLAKILTGLFQPDAGRVTWDGTDLPPAHRRASCSVLLQDDQRYLMSVAENVAISDTSRPADPERVRRSIEAVGLTPAVEALPAGPDTVLGMELEDGGDLSGGQWQRLALARALYRDAPLLVLDEPSAALDPRAEYELFQDVRRLLGGRSAVLISHRYSSVRLADRIVVLHEGRVVEQGDHDELMAAGGRYAELYALQAEAYLSSSGSVDLSPSAGDRS